MADENDDSAISKALNEAEKSARALVGLIVAWFLDIVPALIRPADLILRHQHGTRPRNFMIVSTVVAPLLLLATENQHTVEAADGQRKTGTLRSIAEFLLGDLEHLVLFIVGLMVVVVVVDGVSGFYAGRYGGQKPRVRAAAYYTCGLAFLTIGFLPYLRHLAPWASQTEFIGLFPGHTADSGGDGTGSAVAARLFQIWAGFRWKLLESFLSAIPFAVVFSRLALAAGERRHHWWRAVAVGSIGAALFVVSVAVVVTESVRPYSDAITIIPPPGKRNTRLDPLRQTGRELAMVRNTSAEELTMDLNSFQLFITAMGASCPPGSMAAPHLAGSQISCGFSLTGRAADNDSHLLRLKFGESRVVELTSAAPLALPDGGCFWLTVDYVRNDETDLMWRFISGQSGAGELPCTGDSSG